MVHAAVQDQNQVIAQVPVQCVVAMDKYDQVRVFLQFSKHALNVLVLVNRLLIHVQVVEGKVKNKLVKDFL